MAFLFWLSVESEFGEWGTYYRPFRPAIDQHGREVHVPDISDVNEAVLDYWKGRSTEATNPVLRARYSDLVWDFSKPVTGTGASHQFARIAIEAYIEAADKHSSEPTHASVFRLRRALSLAISLGDTGLIAKVTRSMLTAFRQAAAPGNIGIWSPLFDTLYGHKKVPLSDRQNQDLIDVLEDLLKRSSDRANKSFDPWTAKEAAMRLARHYRNAGRRDDMLRVMRSGCGAFEGLADEADPLFATEWLDEVRKNYRQMGMKEDATRVQLAAKEKGKEAEKSMMETRVPVQINRDDLDAFLKDMTDGELDHCLPRIAVGFIVKEGEARRELSDIAKAHPLLIDLPRSTISEGQVVAEVGPLEEDVDGRIASQIADKILFHSHFLVLCLEKLRDRYNPTVRELCDHLYACPLFDENRRSLITMGLKAYLRADHVTAMHILIPQIEHVVRRLLEELGLPTNKPTRWGQMQEKNVHDMLSDLEATRPSLGEYLPYLKVLLAEPQPRGLNLRNRLCHGLMAPEQFTPQTSALALHALLFLAQLRICRQPPNEAPA